MRTKILGGIAAILVILAWAAFQHRRDEALLARADCAVALYGHLSEDTFRRATRHACTEAGILTP